MPSPSSQTEAEALDELRQLFGDASGAVHRDPDASAAAALARRARGLLAEATRHDKVTVTELAKRLSVSKAAVSRHLLRDGDIRVSTMALIARALGRKFILDLEIDPKTAPAAGNFFLQLGPAHQTEDNVSQVITEYLRSNQTMDSSAKPEVMVVTNAY